MIVYTVLVHHIVVIGVSVWILSNVCEWQTSSENQRYMCGDGDGSLTVQEYSSMVFLTQLLCLIIAGCYKCFQDCCCSRKKFIYIHTGLCGWFDLMTIILGCNLLYRLSDERGQDFWSIILMNVICVFLQFVLQLMLIVEVNDTP